MFDATLLGESRDEFTARLDAGDTFTHWRRLVPELTADQSVGSLAEVFAALAPGSDPGRWDTLLWSLLRLAAVDGDDQSDAVLAVLHAVAASATRLTRRGFEAGLVLGQLTIQIRTYPWRTRRRAVAGNLLRDTENALCSEVHAARMRTRRHVQQVTEIPVDMGPWRGTEGPAAELTSAAADDLDLVDLLLWAERSGVVDARDLAMLVEYHYGRDRTGAGHEHVARVFGVDVRTSKRRCTAALAALQTAVPDYLAS
jgi:hypothetical protein